MHLSHSAFSWQVDGDPRTNADNKAYTVFVDNQEQGGEDVDILDITNPRAPVFINEFSLTAPAGGSSGFRRQRAPARHGRREDRQPVRAARVLLGRRLRPGRCHGPAWRRAGHADSDFLVNDPLSRHFSPPEGNAHQAEFSHDKQFVVAADEDFSPYRLVTDINGVSRDFPFRRRRDGRRRVPARPVPGRRRADCGRHAVRRRGLLAAAVPAPQADETVAVAERGTCDFDVKAGKRSRRLHTRSSSSTMSSAPPRAATPSTST